MTVLEEKRFVPFDVREAAASGRLRIVPSTNRPAVPAGDLEALLHDRRRRKIWELDSNLHCSVIGTCFSTAELRQLLTRLKMVGSEGASDHDLHSQGVLLARNRDGGSRLLNKALDKRHRVAISQFAKARTEAAAAGLWTDAVRKGDIPGAYWAVLTHPEASNGLVRRVFGEVHMLSHLVGAANRADIRRLHHLEQENGKLLAKIERQQAQLRDAVVARDKKIRELSDALSQKTATTTGGDSCDEMSVQTPALHTVIADLERRLSTMTARHERAERRLKESAAGRAEAEATCRMALRERDALLRELASAGENLAALLGEEGKETRALDLRGASVLYIGGRPNQIGHLRAASERASARFLHHDGGIDERSRLLPGLISRADVVMFPVDCVSHDAALTVKRLCRQSGKPWVPLRTASVTAFLGAFETLLAALEDGRTLAT